MSKVQSIIEEIKGLSLLEASELVKGLEEAFGVSAAAATEIKKRLVIDFSSLCSSLPLTDNETGGNDVPKHRGNADFASLATIRFAGSRFHRAGPAAACCRSAMRPPPHGRTSSSEHETGVHCWPCLAPFAARFAAPRRAPSAGGRLSTRFGRTCRSWGPSSVRRTRLASSAMSDPGGTSTATARRRPLPRPWPPCGLRAP